MEHFAPVLGMTMIVLGLLMLMGSFGLLVYFLWEARKDDPEEPHTASASHSGSDGG